MPHQPIILNHKKETAVLIGVLLPQQKEEQLREYLDELAFLAETAGAICAKRFTQRLPHPDISTFVGKGKLNEIAEYVDTNKIDIAIFDDELSGSQIRNIEKVLKCRVLDWNNLIIDIFGIRDRTAHSIV